MKVLNSAFLGMFAVGIFAVSSAWAAPTSKVLVNGQEILTDGNGLTAYTFDPDTTSVSTCYGSCAKEWPPILLPAGETVTAPLGVTTRKDGSQQITYQGHPIYLFVEDQKSGDIKGDGDDGIWHLIVLSN